MLEDRRWRNGAIATAGRNKLTEHLARHGATVNLVRIENVHHGAIADRVQAEAHALGADLIVAGAFGHARLWEKMLGGVTQELWRVCGCQFSCHTNCGLSRFKFYAVSTNA